MSTGASIEMTKPEGISSKKQTGEPKWSIIKTTQLVV
jgi:hypothetical protein